MRGLLRASPPPTLGEQKHFIIIKKARIIARNHYSQLASQKGALSRCELNPKWAIMGHHGLFLTTGYNVWFVEISIVHFNLNYQLSYYTIKPLYQTYLSI